MSVHFEDTSVAWGLVLGGGGGSAFSHSSKSGIHVGVEHYGESAWLRHRRAVTKIVTGDTYGAQKAYGV